MKPDRTVTRLILAAVALALVAVAIRYGNIREQLRQLLMWIADLGPWAPVLFILVYTVACVLFLPAVVLTLGAGVIFGVLRGSIIVSIAAIAGATAAFLVGRYLARSWLVRKFEGNARFHAIDDAVADEGWKIVGLLRLSPLVPFNVLNYALGVSRVSLKDYFWASWFGMIPGTVLFVYIGSLAGDLASIGTRSRERTKAELLFYAVGLIATIAVSYYIARIAKKALDKRIPHADDAGKKAVPEDS